MCVSKRHIWGLPSGDLDDFDDFDDYPLVVTNVAIEMAMEIVSFPINKYGSFHSDVNAYQRVYGVACYLSFHGVTGVLLVKASVSCLRVDDGRCRCRNAVGRR